MENSNENANTNTAEQPKPEQPKTDTAQQPAAPASKKPFYKKGWFWGATGVVAALVGVGAAMWLSHDVADAAETATDAVTE